MIHIADVAESQVGIEEATGQNDGIPANRYMRGNKLAWCGGFVCYCSDNSDDPKLAGTVKKFWSWGTNVQRMEDKLKSVGMWMGWRVRPQRNDIIFFANRGRSDPGRGRHVGIVTGVDETHVHTVEGNTGNAVKRASYKLTDKRITGYGRVVDDL